jgi:hypothetical protein
LQMLFFCFVLTLAFVQMDCAIRESTVVSE